MRDGPEARAALAAALHAPPAGLALVRVRRFRRSTAGSLARGALAGTADALWGDDAGAGPGADERPLGLALELLRSDGAQLAYLPVHPCGDDLEGLVFAHAVRSQARTGAWLELFAEDTPLARYAPPGPREADAGALARRREGPFAGLDVRVAREGGALRLAHERPNHTSSVALPLVLLALALFWWAAVPALLFAQGRAFVFGLLRRARYRGPLRWEATLGPERLEVREVDLDGVPREHALALRDVALVCWAPVAHTTRALGTARWALRALVGERFVYLPTPPHLGAALAAALRA